MNYNSELRKLRNAKKKIVDDILYFDKKTEEINDYCKLIEEKSTMSYEIFLVLSDIMSIFEGEIYSVREIHYHKDESLDSEMLETYVIISCNVYNSIDKTSDVSYRYFNSLLKNNLAIKIVEGTRVKFLPRRFSFYKADTDMGRINPQISFKGFPYVKDFIDYIINSRIENKIDELSDDELEKLKEDFILLNVENIYNNYEAKQEKRIKESIKSINSECEHNKKLLKRIVKKIEVNR